MRTFLDRFADDILGVVATFDRLIFKGHLTHLYPDGAVKRWLADQGVLLKDFGRFAQRTTERIKRHAEALAAQHRRPFVYLQSARPSKEALAKEIAERDSVREGLICVLYTLETCTSFDLYKNREECRLELRRRRRKCLFFYFYFLDPEFGFMHVRIQSWLPFEIQVYVNGREWLARQLDRAGVGYRRYDNALTWVDDFGFARRCAGRFNDRNWVRILNAFARRVNPLLRVSDRYLSYYWVLDQAEYATDVLFRSRQALERIYPDLVQHASLAFGAKEVFRFLGRKLHGNFQGEVTTDRRHRPEGCRVKHRLRRNSIKMYDKWCILRVETTINNPREFRVWRPLPRSNKGGSVPRHRAGSWVPMGKGVAHFRRYAQVSAASNGRYLNALAAAPLRLAALEQLDDLCEPARRDGVTYGGFNPLRAEEARLFEALLNGGHAINGLRNADLRRALYPRPAADTDEARRRSARVSRLLRKLRAHGLLAKVPRARLYRLTSSGAQRLGAVMAYRQHVFPIALEVCASMAA
jgi:hypothetical protein